MLFYLCYSMLFYPFYLCAYFSTFSDFYIYLHQSFPFPSSSPLRSSLSTFSVIILPSRPLPPTSSSSSTSFPPPSLPFLFLLFLFLLFLFVRDNLHFFDHSILPIIQPPFSLRCLSCLLSTTATFIPSSSSSSFSFSFSSSSSSSSFSSSSTQD